MLREILVALILACLLAVNTYADEVENYLAGIRTIAVAELAVTDPAGEEQIARKMLVVAQSIYDLEPDGLSKAVIDKLLVDLKYWDIPSYVDWQDFNIAVDIAKQAKKPVLIEFFTDWCGYCTKFDDEVFSDPVIARKMNAKFVPVRIDAEDSLSSLEYMGQQITYEDFAKQLGVNSYPRIIVMAPDMRQIKVLKVNL